MATRSADSMDAFDARMVRTKGRSLPRDNFQRYATHLLCVPVGVLGRCATVPLVDDPVDRGHRCLRGAAVLDAGPPDRLVGRLGPCTFLRGAADAPVAA